MKRPFALAFVAASAACSADDPGRMTKSDPPPSPSIATSSAAASPSAAAGERKFGAPIGGAEFAKLADIASDPAAYAKKTVKTEGVVTSVCQHMGCWMEIESDTKEAHIKMAGHSFFVPKNLSGRRALVEGAIITGDDPGSCAHEHEGGEKREDCGGAAKAASAKIEIEATGVELVD